MNRNSVLNETNYDFWKLGIVSTFFPNFISNCDNFFPFSFQIFQKKKKKYKKPNQSRKNWEFCFYCTLAIFIKFQAFDFSHFSFKIVGFGFQPSTFGYFSKSEKKLKAFEEKTVPNFSNCYFNSQFRDNRWKGDQWRTKNVVTQIFAIHKKCKN